MAPRRLAHLLAALALVASASEAGAAPALRRQVLVNGDFTIVGNSLSFDCSTIGDPGTAPVVGTVPANTNAGCGLNRTDSGTDVYWISSTATETAVTGGATAAAESAQSSAVLAVPAGATVRYARLYWAAQYSGTVDGYDGAATLVTPSGTAHAVAADPVASRSIATGGQGFWYQSSADVTSLVQSGGRYSVSGVFSRPLWGLNSQTTFAAWWMVVFYEDPAEIALRQLTLFDGLDYVEDGVPADVSLGGFLVPAGFDAKLAVVTYEGDDAWAGDSLYFQGYRSTSPEPTFLTTLADAQNPQDNFFNGTRSWLGAPRSVPGDLPQMPGTAGSMMSFDLDVVDLKALGAIHSGDDTAKIRATSSLDVYALGAFVTSINTLKPSFIETVKTATNLTRASGVFGGDLIEYTIDTRNTGNDPSIQTVLYDALPSGVSYVPDSLFVTSGANAGSKTDAIDSDQAEYVASTHLVVVRLGAGADGTTGGSMPIGDSAQVRFRVTVNPGASGLLQNQAQVVAAGLSGEPARPFESHPPLGTGPTNLPVDQCLADAHCGGATPVCWTDPTPNVCVGCTADAHCGGAQPVCDLALHACVGLTTFAPASQDLTSEAGVSAPFALTLTSNRAGPEVYDLDVQGACAGWSVELWTAGSGSLVATRTAPGAWAIQPGGDTDSDGMPDLGPTSGGGGTTSLVLRLAPPGGAPAGASCAATLSATGSVSGVVATAAATLRVSAAVTWTPSYTGTAAKVVSRGGDVGFPGVIQNNTASPLTFTLGVPAFTATPNQGALQAPVLWSDPNGDGDPADGAPIATVGPVPEFGGRVHVVLVLRAMTSTGTSLATGTVLDATATATSGGLSASQAVQAKVQYAATYSDAARTLASSRFAPCQTVHVGASLLPSGFPFLLEWYPKASPVRGTDAPSRVVDPWLVSGGAGSDSLQLPAGALGTWTILVVQKTTPQTVIDELTFEVERAGAFTALAVPARVGLTGGLSVSASVRNDNASAAYAGSQLAYTVTDGAAFMDGAGAFSATPGTAHLTAPVNVAAGGTASDAWSAAAPGWPAPGLYEVQAEWQVQCGGVTQAIAPAVAAFQVVPNAPVISSPAPGALLSDATPTFAGTALAGASVTVTAGGVPCGPVLADGGGAWSCTPGAALAEGAHSATAVQAVSGAASDPSAAVAFTVDTTPPAVTIAAPSPGELVNAVGAPGGEVVLGGTAEAGASVVVSAGAASAAATRSGAAWSAALTLADGERTVTATATDAAGNAGTAQVTFTLDTTPPPAPVVTAPPDGASLNAAGAPGGVVDVQGTAEAGAAVDVTVGATSLPAARAGTSFSATFALGDGTHAISAIATDAAGNVSAPGTSSFTLDATPPLAPSFAFPLDGAVLGAAQAPGGLVAMTGGTDAGTSVAVTVDGVPAAAAVAGTGWSLSLTLGDGLHPASAVATDGAGNPSPPAIIVFRTDATAPAAPVLAVVPTPTNDEPIAVTGTAEAGATVELFLDGVSQGTAVAGPGFGFSLAGVAAGSHSVQAVATDAALNASPASEVRTFLVDRVAPGLATLDAPADGATLRNADAPGGAVTFSGTSEAGSAVEVEVDGIVVGVAAAPGGTWTATHALLDGPHLVRVRATDAAGNAGGWSAASAFTLHASGPLAPVLDALASPTSADPVTVTGVSDPGTAVGVHVDGVFVGTAAAPLGGFSLDLALGEGTWAITAIAEDAGGNVSPVSGGVSVTVDRTAPAAPAIDPLVTPTQATSLTIAGTTGPGTAVTVYRDGLAVGSATETGGRFSLEVPVGEGTFSFTATAADAAANVSAASDAIAVTVDRTAPAAPSLDPLVTPTNATTVVVTGATDAGTTVTVFRGGDAVGTVAATGTRFALAVPVFAGTVSFTATAADLASNVSPASAAVTIEVDHGVPAAPVLDPLVTPTSAASAAVTGTADPGVTVTLLLDGVFAALEVAAGDGTFSFDVALAEGPSLFTATATDESGNVSPASNAVPVVADRTAPAAPLLAPLDSPTGASTITVAGSAEAGGTVTVYRDGFVAGTAVAAPDGLFAVDVGVAEGTFTFSATAADAVGNVSLESSGRTVVVDHGLPAPPVLAALVSPTNATTLAVSGAAEAGSTVTVYLDGAAAGSAVAVDGSFALEVGAPEGALAVTATSRDAAGNVSAPSSTVFVTVDRTAPAAPVVTAPADGAALGAAAAPGGAVAFSGTAEAGATVALDVDGVVTTFAAATGAWTVTLALADGPHQALARAVDPAGNAGPWSAASAFTLDASVPAAPSLDPLASPTNAATVVVSGTAEAGADVTVLRDGTPAGGAVAGPGGAFSLAVAVPEGTSTFTATAADAAGNVSPASSAVSVTVDLTAPPLGVNPAGPLTNDATPTLSGTSEPGATIAIRLPSVGTATAVADASGGWSWTPPAPLSEGLWAIDVTATDAAGNASATVPVPLEVDTTQPTIVLLPVPGLTSAPSVVFSGTTIGLAAGAQVVLFLDGALLGNAAVAADGTFTHSGAVSPGPHDAVAAATDAAGNLGTSNTVSFLVDRTPPGPATVDAPADGAVLGNAAAPGGAVTFSGTSEAGSAVEVEVDGIVLGVAGAPGGTWTATFTLVGGPHLVRVRATDAAGNVGGWSAASGFDVDLAGPLAPTLDALASPTGSALVTATGAAEAGTSVGVYVDGVFAGTADASTGAFSLELTLADGTRVLTAIAEDAAGNASPASSAVTVVVDLTAPAAPSIDPLVSPTNAFSVLLTGTAEADSLVTVLRDGVAFGTVQATGGTFGLVVPVPQGTRTFVATATDAVGNVSADSAPLVIVVDRLVPAVPALDPLVTPTNAASLTVTGTTDPGTTVTVYLGGIAAGTAPEAGGRFSLQVPVGDGTHAVTAVAADAASNRSAASDAVTVVVDQVAPGAPTLDPLVTPTNASSVTVTGSADAGTAVTVYRDGAPVATVSATAGTFAVTLAVSPGSVTFTATAADAAGNVSPASAGVALVVDHAVPAAPVLDPLVTPTSASSIVVTGGADPGTTVIVLAGGVPAGGAIAAGDGRFAVPVPVDEGPTTFTAVASDGAGNVSPPSDPVTVVADRTAPDAPLLAPLASPTGASTVTVAGTAEAGSAVTVYRDGFPAGVAVAGPSGAFALDVAVSGGTFTFTAEAADAAGNVSPGATGVTVVVDHALPAPPVLAALASPTNATTITVSGTAELGATVTVHVDGVPAGAAPAADGTFTLDLAAPEGDLALTATSRDAAGNVSAPSSTVFVTVDRTPPPAPAVAAPVDGAVLGAAAAPGGRVPLDGTAEAGATVELDVDGAVTTVSAGTGPWAIGVPLADGPHALRARAVDAAGNAGPWTATLAITLDTAAPAAPSLDPLVTPTNAATVLVTGAAEPGATVVLARDGTAAASTVADGGGRFALPVAVGEGTTSFTATATDAAGNVSPPSSPVPVAVDRGAPGAPVLDAPASPTAAASVVVTGTAEAGSTVTLLRDGVPAGSGVAGAGGAFAVAVAVGEGPSFFVATAVDAAGNVSGASNTVSVLVDRTAPAAPALAPLPAATRADPVVVSGTAEAGSTVELFVDGASRGTAAGPAFSFSLAGLAAGSSYSVTAVATDAAGNASPASAPVSFLVDRTAPGLATVVSPADGAQLGCLDAPCGVVTFTGTAEAGSSVEVEVDGVVLLAAADGAGTWTTTDPLADGTHQVRARALDAAGNEGAWSALSAFSVDTAGPSAPVLDDPPSPTAAAAVTVAGTAEAGVPVEIFLDGAFAGTAVANGAGAFSLDVPVAEGTATFTAVARDALGNPSVPSNVVTVEVDHTAPAAPVLGAIASPSGASTVVVSGTAEAGAAVEVFLDGALVGTVVATGGTFTLDVAAGPGSHSVTATATDPAGNVSPASGAEVFSVTVAAPVLAGAGGHVVGGGCGCGPGGGSPASALLLLGLALALAPRRRAGAASRGAAAASRGAAALLLLAAAGAARAQDARFAVDRFQLDPGAYGLLGVASARVPESFDVGLSLGLEGANGLLRLEREGRTTDLVGNVYAAQVGGAVAVGGRYELGLVLPVAISRSTEGGPAAPPAAVTGVGDLKLVPKIALGSAGGFRLAASLPFTVPTARQDALLGEGAFTVNPTGIAETALGRVRLAGNLGVAVRPTRTYYDLEVGPAVTWGAGAELPFRLAGLAWTALAAAWGEIGLADSGAQATPAELDAGVRWQRSGLALTAGLGTGIVNGYGAPALRAFALAAWRPPAPRPAPAPIAKVEPPPPPDPCAPGQAHAPEQCPALDDDGDAVANAQDRCPLVAGVAEEAGCPAKPPPPVVVAVKEEPPPPPPPPPPPGPCDPGQAHAPEQCPALDDDGDGFANAKDRCPLVPGLEAHQGCPPPKAVLSLETKKIEIKEAVFFETGKDRIEKRSHQLLEDIVRILEDHPEVKLVSIEGHTDSTGTPARNQQLSERRASAVKIFLVTKGIEPGRLESRGFGQARPIAKNDTKEGKAKNRRVEFLVR